jgi:hypothetical protein
MYFCFVCHFSNYVYVKYNLLTEKAPKYLYLLTNSFKRNIRHFPQDGTEHRAYQMLSKCPSCNVPSESNPRSVFRGNDSLDF